jgi:hypothetical protein
MRIAHEWERWIGDSNLDIARESIIPSELTGQLPRRTRLAKNGVQSAIVLAILLLIAVPSMIWACMNAMQLKQTRTALRQDSNEVIGRVDKRTKSEFHYSFVVNGRSFTGHASIQLQTFQVSDPLPILYVPTNPSINHPAGWEEPSLVVWFPFFLPILFLLISLAVRISMRIDQRLVVKGIPAVAAITKCIERYGRSGQVNGFTIKYEFRTEYGMLTNGNSSSEVRLGIGASICILYLLRKPSRNQTYTSLCYRAAQ